MTKLIFLTLCLGAILVACAPHAELKSDSILLIQGTGTPVKAVAETEAVGTAGLDAADDPEIWVDPYDSAHVIILGTDKKAGLYAYGLEGKVVDFAAVGALNNVDMRYMDGQVLIGASDRLNNGVALFTLDKTLKLKAAGLLPLPTSEAYGFCMGIVDEGTTQNPIPRIMVAIVGKNGDVAMARLKDDGAYSLYTEHRFLVGSQSEGCVVDDTGQKLYIAEENRGIWVYDLLNPANETRTLLAQTPSPFLKPDVEGLTILHEPDGDAYLIASSQGDSAFAVWDIRHNHYVGRFSVVAGNGIDAVTGTDGVAAHGGRVGPYPEGIVVMQDDSDTQGETPSTARSHQNFKIVDWRDIKSALGI